MRTFFKFHAGLGRLHVKLVQNLFKIYGKFMAFMLQILQFLQNSNIYASAATDIREVSSKISNIRKFPLCCL